MYKRQSSRYAARRWGATGAVAAVLLYYRTTIVCGVAPVAAVLLYYTIVCGVAPHTTPISLSDWSVLWCTMGRDCAKEKVKDEMEPSDWPVLRVGR